MSEVVEVGIAERVRELRRDELHLLKAFPLFAEVEDFSRFGDKVRAIGVFDDAGQLAGYWMLFDAVHVEPIWLREDQRKNPGILRQLWSEVRRVLVECDVPLAFAIIGDGGLAENIPQAMRMGFEALKGNLFYIRVADAPNVRRD